MERSQASDYSPAPADEPAVYPGRRPRSSFLYVDGGVHPLGDAALATVKERLATGGRTSLDHRIPVLCSGSNANPAQIAHKLAGSADGSLPVLLCRVAGLRAVYAGHVASYGAIPATLERVDEEVREIFVGFYTRDQLDGTVRSEHGHYRLCRLPQVRCELGEEARLDVVLGFLSRRGVLTLDGDAAVPLESYDQVTLLATLFSSIEDPTLPGVREYLSHPDAYRLSVERGLDRCGLRRDHRVANQPVDPADVAPASEVLTWTDPAYTFMTS